MISILVIVTSFVAVSALVGAVAFMLRGEKESSLETRLDILTGLSSANLAKEAMEKNSLLANPLDDQPGFVEQLMSRFGNLSLLFEQADTSLTPSKFFAATGLLALGGVIAFSLTGLHPGFLPLVAVGCGMLPLMWLIMRRKRRLKKFAAQLPDALELVARALRAGHSLASGFSLVADEMQEPISKEFGRLFEEQNLGIPLEQALTNATNRVPNLDLKFFATAIILQRQTGGDLAEILDKIGHIIRERFIIWGQVQALTGEGRLSGIVLLALPPVLFITVYRMNPEYMSVLFTDPMGKKMLIGGVLSQILGALVIRKIVNIKV